MQTKDYRLRALRPCFIRGVYCDVGAIVEADLETACEALSNAAAEPADAEQRARFKSIPTLAWKEPEIDRGPRLRIIAGAETAVAANGANGAE